MKRNVTIQKKEERTLEALWVLRGYKCKSNFDLMNTTSQIEFKKEATDTKKFDELPSDNEIAQFIHDTESDYVKLEHIFRLCDCDIPFN